MKTKNFTLALLLFLCTATLSFAQTGRVGINTTNPKSTLDLVGKPTVVDEPDGMLIPRLSGDQLKAKDAAYQSAQEGSMVYVTAATSIPRTTKTVNVLSKGLYYYDGSVWLKSDTTDDEFLNNPTLQRVELGRKSTKTSRDAGNEIVFNDNGNVGFGTTNPLSKLHVAGPSVIVSDASLTQASILTKEGGLELISTVNPETFVDFRKTMVDDYDVRLTYISNIGSKGGFSIRSRTSVDGEAITSSDRLTVDNATGNVGIATGLTLAHSTLQVNGSVAAKITTLASGTVAASDYTILVGGNISLPAPSTTNSGRIYNLINNTNSDQIVTGTIRMNGSNSSSYTLSNTA